jgi:superfamily II DNA or RNA helicase
MKKGGGDKHSDLPLFGLAEPVSAPRIVAASPLGTRVDLFLDLFKGHDLHVPYRYEMSDSGKERHAILCENEWDGELCQKRNGGLPRCASCTSKAFLVDKRLIFRGHLGGAKEWGRQWQREREFVAGVYPVAADGTCGFICVGFEGHDWRKDARVFLDVARLWRIPVAVEAGRNGKGGRTWVFFEDAVAAKKARALANSLVTETMERRPEIDFSIYDRVWPDEDTAISPVYAKPVALPLQLRQMEFGHTIFLDDDMAPIEDQWAFLSQIRRLSAAQVEALTKTARRADLVLGVRLVEEGDFDATAGSSPKRHVDPRPLSAPLPQTVHVEISNQVYVDRTGMPAPHVRRIAALAAFQNPAYITAQLRKRETSGKSRVIARATVEERRIALPRGCLPDVLRHLERHGARPELDDRRFRGVPLPADCRFTGTLEPTQQQAFDALLPHDIGVVEGPPSFGKTVLGAAMVAARGVSSLVLVNRSILVRQWQDSLRRFLDIDPALIGTISNGKWRNTGVVDIAIIQGLAEERQNEDDLTIDDLPDDFIARYGNILVDECHHIAAPTYEAVMRRSPAAWVTALSATTGRADGQEPVVFMQCGPIRHRTTAAEQAAERGIGQKVIQRRTRSVLPPEVHVGDPNALQEIYQALSEDEERNDQIVADVVAALEKGRCPVVISERREHLDVLAKLFDGRVDYLAIMRGQMNKAEKIKTQETLDAPTEKRRLILATGAFLGEGFDDPRLETLFLTMPISTEAWIRQYTGRLQRKFEGKDGVEVYDYLDFKVPRLVNMWKARQSVYEKIGFEIVRDTSFIDEEDEEVDWEMIVV